MSHKRHVYFWEDGIYFNARKEEKQCLLVIIGGTRDDVKELVPLDGKFRKGELSWTYDFPAAHWEHIRTTNPIGSNL